MGVRYSESQSIFAFGPHQTNFQTEVAPAALNYRWITKDGYAKAAFDSPNVPNTGESTGLALPDETRKDKDSTSFAATEQLTYQLLGIRAFDAFGVTATPTEVVTGEVWTQTFSLLDPFVGRALPSRPLVSKVAEPTVGGNEILDARYPSMTYNRFTVSDQGDKPNLSLDSEWLGSGQLTEPSGVNFYKSTVHVVGRAALKAEENINKRAGVVTIYPQVDFGGSEIVTNCLTRGVTLTIDENLNADAGYDGCGLFQDGDATKGAIRGALDSNGQTVSYEITLVADSAIMQSLDVNEKLKTGAEISIKQSFTGGEIGTSGEDYNATFKLNRAVIASADWTAVDGGLQGIRLVLTPLANGNNLPLTLELTTEVEDFSVYIKP